MSTVDKTRNTVTELLPVTVSEVNFFFFLKLNFILYLSLSLFLHSQMIMFTLDYSSVNAKQG